jgi:Uma2 family endonuclease
MRNRLSPVIVRGMPLNMPTAEEFERDPAAALKRLPSWKDLPSDDGEPMESPWHYKQMTLLIETLTHHWRDRNDVFIGGNMFLYYNEQQEFNRDFRGPDFFVVNGDVARNDERLSWITWKEFGRLPDLIIELVSPSTAKIDRGEKQKLYTKRFRVHEYFCYDPSDERLEGWRRLPSGKYVTIEAEQDGRMWSEELKLHLDLWSGEYLKQNGRWLRLATRSGALLPTTAELAAAEATRADAEAARAEAQAARAEAQTARAEAEAAARRSSEAELAKLKRQIAALRKKKK